MNALFEAAREVCEFMQARRWQFCLIGGLAVQRWGEMRTTLDADITLFTGFGDEERFIDALLSRFPGRVPDAREFALRVRVLLVRASNGKDIDIGLGGFPFEAEMIRRASDFEFASGVVLPTCSAEDLFVLKVFAARGKDLHDAETVAIRQKLDRRYVLRQLRLLCELRETPELVDEARRILEKHPWPA
ncbi:MAG: hypothetical protein A3K19_10260 [Lentisphaerae bacterium RIFOXYB12_FULL_65_16]|nr:MAG: hypothetical protein A3K18_32120 [Lentisphaerae bacterium RIFOXYA12_64_32]OGV91599.1 MAG: hypothetical protein A3K19_10260 [Lentisphaerae bacterium RIFOXYB12_FULL_65_16]